jgi:ketosteroid isomerase-like protein
MNETVTSTLVHRYVEGWKTADRAAVLETLDPDCVIIESYGPIYRGKEMVERWITSWFGAGNEISRWDVTSFSLIDEVCFFEWIFECTFDGKRDGFEGASIARFKHDKIHFLREYATTAPLYEWAG